MSNSIYSIEGKNLGDMDPFKEEASKALESGKVVFLPFYTFQNPLIKEKSILTECILDSKHKNISYNDNRKTLGGYNKQHSNLEIQGILTNFLQDFVSYSKILVETLFPHYVKELRVGRTSYRPAEISHRIKSKRKDDTRLHVDSFASTPVHGLRILRVFCNINPFGEPRVWNLGEPFQDVLEKFAGSLTPYNLLKAKCLYWLKLTKSIRSAYDHYQLLLHDTMKLDEYYQQNVSKERVEFPPYSSWIVFSDQASHAALRGQFLLEQTFYLPVSAMLEPETSPLKHWEKIMGHELLAVV